jgi:hypothetical protein
VRPERHSISGSSGPFPKCFYVEHLPGTVYSHESLSLGSLHRCTPSWPCKNVFSPLSDSHPTEHSASEPVTPNQIILLKLLDSYLQSTEVEVDGSGKRELTWMLSAACCHLAIWPCKALRRALGIASPSPRKGTTDEEVVVGEAEEGSEFRDRNRRMHSPERRTRRGRRG